MGLTILISTDLFFIAKVKEVALSLNAPIKVARSLAILEEALVAAGEQPGVLIIDFERRAIEPEVLATVVSRISQQGWRTITFFSHVHTDDGAAAAALGLGEVMPRSKFVKILPSIFSAQPSV